MSKQLIPDYAFDASARTVTLPGFDSIELGRLLLVVNATRGVVLYSLVDPGKGGSVSGNVLTLAYDTTAMSDADQLTIMYQTAPGDPEYDKLIIGNARDRFRDGFASQGVQPDPATWAVENDDPGTPGTPAGEEGHILVQGGNAYGSSYLRVSMSPFVDDSRVTITSKEKFKFPLKVGFGVTTSQRLVGQEVFFGLVEADDSDPLGIRRTVDPGAPRAITANGTVTSNVLALSLPGHGFQTGDRVYVTNCPDTRMNVGPVLVTVTGVDGITVPVTIANGTYTTTGGEVRHADPLSRSDNAVGLLLENSTATNATFTARRNGSKYRLLNSTIASTGNTQGTTSGWADAFQSTGTHELYATIDEVSFRSWAADGNGGMSGSGKYSQSIPDDDTEYRLHVRARNLDGLSKPQAQIVSIAKSGTTTATVTTDRDHGLTVNSRVGIYGVRNQAAFPNTADLAVASVPSSTTFTVVLGTASTTTDTDGGVVFVNHGGVTAPGAFNFAVQSVSRDANGVVTAVMNATMSGHAVGEFVHLWGLNAATAGFEGAYRVLSSSGTSIFLQPAGGYTAGAAIASANTGGALIRRTDVRLHYARVMAYTRHAVEVTGGRGTSSDANNAVPVTVSASSTVPASQSTGSASTIWNAAGWGGLLVADIASAAITATATSAAVTPGAVGNVGTYTHSFSAVVTAVSGTTPTLDIGVEESQDNGTNWVRIYDFPRITAAGVYSSPPIQATWGTRYRYVRTVGGTTPSFTMAMNRLQLSTPQAFFRSFVDRTALSAAAPALNTATPTYFVERAKTINATMTLGTATTAPVVTLEGSEDGANWYALPNGVLTGAASSTVMANVTGVLPKFVRGRVTTAGAGLAGDRFVTIKALEG